ncbi:tripartite motif-containing protein 16-like [Trichomycterus rosablanca]|uniref:tripartite motif-containing protein 16-like n=1 Tax=Trichomycterus rosablanca TaxID=2290929 RepID=UPI002F351A3B
MAEASISIDHEHLNCPICLFLLKDPVTTPCGHSFCMVCINGFWDDEQKRTYSCPQCRETFTPRPVLRKSNVLAGVIESVQKTELQASFDKVLPLEVQDVECDFCIDEKKKAVKSCLTCMASYCDTHVQPHHEVPAFKKHQLVSAIGNLEEKTCTQHNKLLEVFCRTDRRAVCYQCLIDNHKGHNIVTVQEEWMEKKKQFGELQMKYQNRLEKREKILLELKELIESFKRSAQAAVEDSEKIFSELHLSIEKRRYKVTELIRAQEKAELDQMTGLLEQLEHEIADLKTREAKLEKLSHTDDYIQFVQSFLSSELESDNSCKVAFNPQWSFENFKTSLFQLKEELEDFCKERIEKITENVNFGHIIKTPEPETREEFLKYSCELSLDPNTVNFDLVLLDDNTKVKCDGKVHSYISHPERFTSWHQVLCKQSVSQRSYWEAEVDSENGVSVAMSYKGISRNGSDIECRFGHNTKSWRLVCYPTKYYFWHNNVKIDLTGPKPKRIGVYLNQNAGTLSFYSVSDRMTLIHKVTSRFTEPLYPGFGIGFGSCAKICLQVSDDITAGSACGN